MKILQVIPSLASGGAERFVVDLCNELDRKGNEVHLCVFYDPGTGDNGFYLKELKDTVHFISLDELPGFRLKKVRRLNSVIKKIDPDVIHLHLGALFYLYFNAIFNRKHEYVYTIHNLPEEVFKFKFVYPLNQYIFRKDYIHPVVISGECETSFFRFYKNKNETLIYNGRSKVEKTPAFETVRHEIEKFRPSGKEQVFIHVARFHEQKNQALLIHVFNRLFSEGVPFVLLILGNWSDDEQAEELQQQACGQIHFLGTRSNIGDYLHLSDAFCLTSIYEGLPISLLEAFCCGCVPICTPVGGMIDVILDGKTGYLSSGITEESYYQAVKRFIDRKDLIQRSSLMEYFEQNYSIEKCADSYLSLFNKITHGVSD
jgi:glycosyltransferase involved in cell wall biosynthesis